MTDEMANHLLETVTSPSITRGALAQISKTMLEGTFVILGLLFTIPLAMLISYTVNPIWMHRIERQDRILVLSTLFIVLQLAVAQGGMVDLAEIMESEVARRCFVAAACIWEPVLAMLATYVIARELCKHFWGQQEVVMPVEDDAETDSQQSWGGRTSVETVDTSSMGSVGEYDETTLLQYHVRTRVADAEDVDDDVEAPIRGTGFMCAGNMGYATFQQPDLESLSGL